MNITLLPALTVLHQCWETLPANLACVDHLPIYFILILTKVIGWTIWNCHFRRLNTVNCWPLHMVQFHSTWYGLIISIFVSSQTRSSERFYRPHRARCGICELTLRFLLFLHVWCHFGVNSKSALGSNTQVGSLELMCFNCLFFFFFFSDSVMVRCTNSFIFNQLTVMICYKWSLILSCS